MQRTLFIFSILLLAATIAQASIVVTFDQPSQSGRPGDLLKFMGVISNTGSDTVFLNGRGFSGPVVTGPVTIIDQFDSNVPFFLDGGTSSGDIDLFDIHVNSGPFTLYPGTYTLRGGVDSDADLVLTTAEFSVQVVPEPASIVLLAAALVPFAIRRRTTRRD